jgi:ABC-type uncharacterized transport system auxiliary subunit
MLKSILNYRLAVLGVTALLAGCASSTPLDTFSLSTTQVQVAQKRKNVQI